MNLGCRPSLIIVDKLDYLTSRTLLPSLTPKHLAIAIADLIYDYAAIITLENITDIESFEANIQLLALIKKFTICETDADLGKRIGPKMASLSMVQKWKTKFGIYPLLEILKKTTIVKDGE